MPLDGWAVADLERILTRRRLCPASDIWVLCYTSRIESSPSLRSDAETSTPHPCRRFQFITGWEVELFQYSVVSCFRGW